MILRFIGVDMVSNMLRSIGGSMDTLQGKLSTSAESFRSKMSVISSSFLGVAQLFGGLTLGIGAAFVSTVKAANELDQTIFLLHAHAGLASSEIEPLTKQLLSMGDATGYSAQQLANASFWVFSLREKLAEVKGAPITLADAMTIQANAAKLALVSNADLGETTKSVVQVLTSGIPIVGGFGTAAGQLNRIVADGALKMDELNLTLRGGLAGTAALLHVPLDQIGAALDALTAKGFSAQTAGIGLRNAMVFLTHDSKPLEDSLGRIGLKYQDVTSFLDKGDLVGALSLIEKHLQGVGSASERMDILAGMFGRTRGVAAGASLEESLGLGAGNADKFAEALGYIPTIIKDIDQGQSQLDQDSATFLATPAGAVKRMDADLTNLWTSVGEGGKTVLPGLVKALDPVIQGVQHWIDDNHDLIASVGPAAVEITALTAGIAGLMAVITGIAAINPLTLGVFVGLVTAAVLIKDHWSQLKPLFDYLTALWRDDLVPIGKNVAKIFTDDIVPAFEAVGGVLGKYVLGSLKLFLDALNGVLGWVQGHAGGAVQGFFEGLMVLFTVNKIRDWGTSLVSWTGQALSNVTQMVSKLIGLNAGGAVSITADSVGVQKVWIVGSNVGLGGPGIGPGAGITTTEEEAAAGAAGGGGFLAAVKGGLGSVLKFAGVGLMAVWATDFVSQVVSQGKNASIFDPQAWVNTVKSMLGDHGSHPGLEGTGEVIASKYGMSPGSGTNVDTSNPLGNASYVNFVNDMKSRLTSGDVLGAVTSGDSNGIASMANILNQTGGADAKKLGAEYATLSNLVHDGRVKTGPQLTKFLTNWNIVSSLSSKDATSAFEQSDILSGVASNLSNTGPKITKNAKTWLQGFSNAAISATETAQVTKIMNDHAAVVADQAAAHLPRAGASLGEWSQYLAASAKLAQDQQKYQSDLNNAMKNNDPAFVASLSTLVGALSSAGGYASNLARALRDISGATSYANSLLASGRVDAAGWLNSLAGHMGRLASGGSTFGGKSYLVGEHGPEIWSEKRSGQMYNASQTRSMLSNGGSDGHSEAMLAVLQQMLHLMSQQKGQPGNTSPSEVDQRFAPTGVMQQIYALLNNVQSGRRRGLYGAGG